MTTGEGDPHVAALAAAAVDLQAQHRVMARGAREIPLLARLGAMPAWLARARAQLAHPEPALAKAADWLLDNDYLVERAVRQVHQDLPSGFYARLPRLVSGDAETLPRIFSIAHGLLHASRLQLSLDAAVRFVGAYQQAGEPLTIAELWAFPALLRTACLELLTASLARLMPDLPAPAPATLPALVSTGLDDTDCVARALANLRVIDAISWMDFFARTSRVEAILDGDPAGIYPRMDFETSDRYRRAVEVLAEASGCAEPEVAERVVEHARSRVGSERSLDHVGYWLVGEGAPALGSALGCRVGARARLAAWAERRAGALYALALVLATAAALVLPALYLRGAGASPLMLLAGIAVALLPGSVVSFTLVHWLITLSVTPRSLPKLDFSKGIPSDCRCAVVIPALAFTEADARELVAQLEGHYLANPDPALEFALLTDWGDAPAEHMPGDEAAVAALREGVRELGRRYGAAGRHPFHLLHRPRRWNPGEGCWMGWERKRGKLEELNGLLGGERSVAFSVREGHAEQLIGIRFVLTVDTDTRLPPGSVARLVGTLAHPLNRAHFDEASGRVVGGYTVIQPRVEIAPEAGTRSWFARLYAGDTSIDIYTRAVSDVYQDLFGSGSFVGKGIYELASFQRSLAGRVPENALASHDLFEGAHGRVALASDIVLYEGFPSGYDTFVRRWHRWVRGDWQLLPWLGGRVPGPDGARLANRLSLLDRWKILDNLRRSLLPPALVLLLAAGWLILPGSPWMWTAFGLAAPAASLFTDLVTGLSRGRRRGAVRGALRAAADHAGHWFLSVTFLAQDAVTAVDAVARTAWRLRVSRRGLLEWTSAADVEARHEVRSRGSVWRRLAAGPLTALAAWLALATLRPSALLAAGPILVLWALSPEIAFLIARPSGRAAESLTREDERFLRRLARRTWLFFEMFVGPEDHWLPPDNVQEHPGREIAHRTSPTNIGMALLSTLSAADFGYLGTSELVVRLRNTLETLGRVPRHRGHVLNWIDTRSLEALEPRYVSAVDSGNLAVSLVALEEGCVELAQGPALRAELWDGLLDVLGLLGEALARVARPADGAALARVAAMEEQARAARGAPERWHAALALLCEVERPELDRALAAAPELEGAPADVLREIRTWLERTHHHLHAMQRELAELAPWWACLDGAPRACDELVRALRALLPPSLPLAELEARCAEAEARIDGAVGEPGDDLDGKRWRDALRAALAQGAAAGGAVRDGLRAVAKDAEAFAWGMDFKWLYDPDTRRLRIGYNVSADRHDPNHYDLLASEARLASFFAIAKGDVPLEHWFHLGRPITRASGGLALVSWGGSMFEYLMPPLLLRSQPGTLLAQSERAAVDTQRRWAAHLGMPWGASESAFAALDPGGHYRYQSFGVPGLGLRRGLAKDRVVAPYASALALPIRARAAAENLRALDALGLGGLFGLFEAVDFTPERLAPLRRCHPVRSYMAHHQGMILAALDNALHDDALVRRFHADLRMRATELLLHERIPREIPSDSTRREVEVPVGAAGSALPAPGPWLPAGVHDAPRVHLLGNGRLCSWISKAGGGALHWHGQAVTRFRADATCDDWGVWLYVRDEADGAIWSVGRQPAGVAGDEATVIFHPHQVEFHRRDRGIGLRMEVVVPPGDDLEIRRVSVVNESEEPRVLSLTSYGEVVLAPSLEDERHPAFSKLFVGAEWLPGLDGLLLTRRPRHPREQPPVVLHRVIVGDVRGRCVGFEADRAAFLGRGGDVRRPRGVAEGLGGGAGYTLDPVMALQVRVTLEPDERCELAFLTFAGGSRESVLEAAERYTTLAALEWARADAAGDAVREAQTLELEPRQLPELQALASLLLHPHRALAAPPERRAANRLGQSRLWGLGLSGDLPILLVRCGEVASGPLLEEVVRGHELWRRRGLGVDLVVLRSGVSAYVEPLRERLFSVLRAVGAQDALGGRGGVHLVLSDQIRDEERCLLECAARVVLDDARGSLAAQLAAVPPPPDLPPLFQASERRVDAPSAVVLERPQDLLFDNGLGGFTPDGREYVIHLEPGAVTPAPWSNVLANEGFGSLVTESGGGFTWCGNSGENRLTPWTNDPVSDPPSEALYLRDEQTGAVWTPTPRPAGGGACQIRHGAGYSAWRSIEHELDVELLVFVPCEEPVKIARLRLRNLSERPRRVTATQWVEWLLGALPSISRQHVVSEWEPAGPALLARNPWSADFAEHVAFLTATAAPHGVTADRREFLGPEGRAADPAALRRWGLSGRAGPGMDSGAAYQVHLDIAPGADAEVAFVIGQGHDRSHALELALRWREAPRIEAAFDELAAHWDRRLGAVRVRTGDAAFDLLANRWLLQQTLGSRVLARAGFYQAGGAYGFRDQLQDVLALLHCEPERARAHLLACAAHQFEEGDVLHWWHPPADRGVRTRCSDDLLWLPWAASQYVEATGDMSILEEEVPFLHAAPLAVEEADRYARFEVGRERRSFMEHCERALERGVTRGPHGLPRIGAGDWNDGFDRIGARGRGESVWLGWFSIAAMRGFSGLCERRGDAELAKRWRERAVSLAACVEQVAWDGDWYMRAFDDDGRAWGSKSSDECRIDSIAQSWAVLSGAGDEERARRALASARRELVSDAGPLVRLLWPPFDATPRDPGYIKAYPPGVRENGGQYTHAAAWLGAAFAAVGDGDTAHDLFTRLGPIAHTTTPEEMRRYRVEPYVVAADIAGVPPHVGRGGWTWYTGSAAWTWRLAVEGILGLRLRDGALELRPCLPRAWDGFEAEVRGPAGALAIRVRVDAEAPEGLHELVVDGAAPAEPWIAFPTDGSTRRVEFRLGRRGG